MAASLPPAIEKLELWPPPGPERPPGPAPPLELTPLTGGEPLARETVTRVVVALRWATAELLGLPPQAARSRPAPAIKPALAIKKVKKATRRDRSATGLFDGLVMSLVLLGGR
jgi:hypothetical protein